MRGGVCYLTSSLAADDILDWFFIWTEDLKIGRLGASWRSMELCCTQASSQINNVCRISEGLPAGTENELFGKYSVECWLLGYRTRDAGLEEQRSCSLRTCS